MMLDSVILAAILFLALLLADLFASLIPGRAAASGGRSAFTTPDGPGGEAPQRHVHRQRPFLTDYG